MLNIPSRSRIIATIPDYTAKQLFVLTINDIGKKTFKDRNGVRRYVCNPQAVKWAAELVCFFPDNQMGSVDSIRRADNTPTGHIRLHFGQASSIQFSVDVSPFKTYRVWVPGQSRPREYRELNEVLSFLGVRSNV